MSSLPQHDRSPTRQRELERIRSQYVWDHHSLAPYPGLKIEAPEQTGILNLVALLIGSLEGLPERELPPAAFMIDKIASSIRASMALLERVPPADWAAAMNAALSATKAEIAGWFEGFGSPVIQSWREHERERVGLPQVPELLDVMLARTLDLVAEIASEVDRAVARTDVVSDALQRVVVTVLEAVDAPEDLRWRVGEITASRSVEPRAKGEGQRARAAGAEAAAAGLDPKVVMAMVALQTLLRFAAKSRNLGRMPAERAMDRATVTSVLPDPHSPDPTLDDATFGRWHTAGPNCTVLARVRERGELPPGFPVTDEELVRALEALGVAGEADAARSLEAAIAAGRLYLVDFGVLAGLPCSEGADLDFFGRSLAPDTARQRYLPAPYCLLYRSANSLLPVAIQLGREPEHHERFGPSEAPELWQRVKMAYLCAYLNHHEMFTHLGGVHFVLIGFVVSAARQLHPDHPVSALLRPHFEWLLWNDFLGLQVLVNPAGFIDQIMPGTLDEGSMALVRAFYEQFELEQFDFPAELRSRGVDDPELLPDYPLRDDGMLLWDALSRFVQEFLTVYYREDADLRQDHELQAWLTELRAAQGAHVPGMPARLDDLDALARLLTGLMFRSSVFHSAVNYPQYDFFSYPARSPASLCADPRAIRSTATSDYLPGGDPALTQIAVLDVLAGMRDQVLSDYALAWFEDPRVWPAVGRLRVELDAIEAKIEAANQTRPAYDYLLPSRVASSANV